MNRTKKEQQLFCTAYHEAGHAVAYFLLDFSITRVSVIPDEENLGHVRGYKKSRRILDFLETIGPFPNRAESGKIARWHDEVVCRLAGMEAVRLFVPGSRFRAGTVVGQVEKRMRGPRKVRFGAIGDVPLAFNILYDLHGEDEAKLVYRWLALRARRLVEHPIAHRGIEALAKALIERRELSGTEARKVIHDSLPQFEETEKKINTTDDAVIRLLR